jgi:hypothetical protein
MTGGDESSGDVAMTGGDESTSGDASQGRI